MPQSKPRSNVIMVGGAGCGKSGIVKMLSDKEVADPSSGAGGCTFQSRGFKVDVPGQAMTLWNTVGFDEDKTEHVPNSDAIVQLHKLICDLSDGVSLLMFVMRASNIDKSSVLRNWKLFRKTVCQGQVPAVVVITGLEQTKNRDEWWWNNKGVFQACKIFPEGHACITATRGKGRVFEEEYAQSTKELKALIRSTALVTPWRVPKVEWFNGAFLAVLTRKTFEKDTAKEALKKLVSDPSMLESQAKELKNRIESADVW